MKRYTSKQVIATQLGWDQSELEEYRYHYGRTDKAVYAIGEKYYCATPKDKQPAKQNDGIQWEWKEKKSSYADSIGWIIWEA